MREESEKLFERFKNYIINTDKINHHNFHLENRIKFEESRQCLGSPRNSIKKDEGLSLFH